jgi:hypothetical protein
MWKKSGTSVDESRTKDIHKSCKNLSDRERLTWSFYKVTELFYNSVKKKI